MPSELEFAIIMSERTEILINLTSANLRVTGTIQILNVMFISAAYERALLFSAFKLFIKKVISHPKATEKERLFEILFF